MNKDVRSSLDNVYNCFKQYTLENPKDVGCFDFGPSDEELKGISKNLKDIPDDVVGSMEFFGDGWDSWGSKEEVKYFLPRIFEYIANDISRLEDAGTFSFFNYKLIKCLQSENKEWNDNEKQSIENFFSSLLSFHFSNTQEIADLVEAALAVGISPELLHIFWEQNITNKPQSTKYLGEEYKTSINKNIPATAKQRLYYENVDEISKFLNLISNSQDKKI